MTNFMKIRRAADVIRAGGIVAYPTEAVYGLGCDPDDADAVRRILALKRRPESAGVILIAADPTQLAGWIAPTGAEADRLAAGDEGATWVVTAAASAPTWITGGRDTIAVRITRYPVAAALCRAAGRLLY
ncbi:MAG: Sua5/YciO/YrdC/YwlC family protein [Gammaproteobacteria bacterium]|nr:Sua5/YciO/YrdC/YwlC family protein [Gammaproteobacteria bacterium]